MNYGATDLSALLGDAPPPVHVPAPSTAPATKPPTSGQEADPIPATMREPELAAFLGLSASRVRTLSRDGVFVRTAPGRYDVGQSVRNYVARLRESAERAGRPTTATDELKAEKLRLTRAQADKEETRVKREAAELVSAEAVTREWAGILRDLRNALLAVPSRCGAVLPHLTATDTATLDREIRKALEGVAHGN